MQMQYHHQLFCLYLVQKTNKLLLQCRLKIKSSTPTVWNVVGAELKIVLYLVRQHAAFPR
jgi:isopentenyldiphosphate isomerase